MNRTTLAFISGGALCTCLLALMAASTHAEGKKSRETTQESSAAGTHDSPDSARAGTVRRIISGMSPRAQQSIHIDSMDSFLSALDGVTAADAQSAAGDLPLLVLVDKQHSLPDGYVPGRLAALDGKGGYSVSRAGLSLRPEAYEALGELSRAALADGIRLQASSAYRSYSYQKTVYEKWVRIDGQEEADRESARPGTSQHQLGTAVDFGSISDDFDTTPEGAWMYAHAAEYGWSLSFPKGYEDATGYRWECWHFRYIGKKACAFQAAYFGGIQQFMIEFLDAWKKDAAD